MTTNDHDHDQDLQGDPETPRKKGGGDGDAKSAVPKEQAGKQPDDAYSSQANEETDVRSRHITS